MVHQILFIISLMIVVFGLINLLRMSLFLIGADIYSLLQHIRSRKSEEPYFPTISIVIPAYNEERTILRCIKSIYENDYPKVSLQIIVVDDGSSDETYKIVKDYKHLHSLDRLHLVYQANSGKAHALNRGMKYYATGELVMCLDADSYLNKSALKIISLYFKDKHVMGAAMNVKVAPQYTLLNLVQRFEYAVCYQMKRAQTIFNIEYIIGGIGSTFRKSFLERINFYDVNTVTEDIDITMKMLRGGNRHIKIVYASDAIAYTQGVLTIKELINQRYRWKWGRYQTFFKNRSMFFTRDKKFTTGLTWIYLPFALWSDFTFLFEPIIVCYMIGLSLFYKDIHIIGSAFITMTFYLCRNILAEDTIPLKTKVLFMIISPAMYIFFYILSFVEYMALIKAIINLQYLSKSLTNNKNTWIPVKRFEYSG